MAIVAVEIESVHGDPATQRHLVFYRAQDSQGAWHNYGPVHAAPGFDREAHKAVVQAKVEASLAESEFNEMVR